MPLHVQTIPGTTSAATTVAAAGRSPPGFRLASDSTGFIGLMWIVIFLIRIFGKSAPARPSEPRAPSPPPPPRPVEGGYAVPCPICGQRDLQTARRIEVVRGRGFRPIVETHTIAGCSPCVRAAGAKLIRLNFRTGFRSLGGLVATPVVIAREAFRVYDSTSTALADELLRDAGLDPDEVRLNVNGITRQQQRTVNAAAAAFAPIIWADGGLAVKSHQRAARAMRRLTGDRLPADRATLLLNLARLQQANRAGLTRALSGTLFRMLRDIAIAEGPLSRRKLVVLYDVAAWLGHSKRDVEVLLGAFATPQPDPEYDDHRHHHRTHDRERARDDGHRSYEESRRRYSPPLQDDLSLARAVLGVSATATYAEIQGAYRILIAHAHPDRAGSDPKVQARRTRRTQELTWAMAALRRAAYRGWS